jgi:hypothetical protein
MKRSSSPSYHLTTCGKTVPPWLPVSRKLAVVDDMITKRGMIEGVLASIATGGSPLNQSLAMISAALTPTF